MVCARLPRCVHSVVVGVTFALHATFFLSVWVTSVQLSSSGAYTISDAGSGAFNSSFGSCPIVRYTRNGAVFAIYKRLTCVSPTIDPYGLFTHYWSSPSNVLNTDFKLYSSEADMHSDANAWTYCNYDLSDDAGFPLDCGPTSASAWTFFTFPGGTYSPTGLTSGASLDVLTYTSSQCMTGRWELGVDETQGPRKQGPGAAGNLSASCKVLQGGGRAEGGGRAAQPRAPAQLFLGDAAQWYARVQSLGDRQQLVGVSWCHGVNARSRSPQESGARGPRRAKVAQYHAKPCGVPPTPASHHPLAQAAPPVPPMPIRLRMAPTMRWRHGHAHGVILSTVGPLLVPAQATRRRLDRVPGSPPRVLESPPWVFGPPPRRQ